MREPEETTDAGMGRRYAIEVDHPLRGWVRLCGRYSTRARAREWLTFVRAAWHGLPARVVDAAQREIDAEFDRLSREESQRAVDQAEQPGAWPTPEEIQDWDARR